MKTGFSRKSQMERKILVSLYQAVKNNRLASNLILNFELYFQKNGKHLIYLKNSSLHSLPQFILEASLV